MVRLLLLFIATLHSCKKGPEHHFIDVQGKPQHVLTWGKGEPVVVFLNGGGSDLQDFGIVQKSIAQITKTFSYDKPGLGKSQMIDVPRTLENVVEELRELLVKEGIVDVPVILVGHSMGGYVARYYLHRYPKNVAGMVLIDPGSEFLNDEYRKVQTQKEIMREDSILLEQIKLIPKGFQMEVLAYPLHDSLLKTFSINTDIPITLIESNKVDGDDPSHKKLIEIQKRLYRDFQRKVPQTNIISTVKSGHFVQRDEPELVIAAIKGMLVDYRKPTVKN
ncbi:alpha/beta fold hydrolase [Pelagihabitans pacificus]|nr:alpha/beta hydrolase [Pelagihabitans pacificus]